MAGSMQQVRSWRGPAVLSFGFRPFFLGAALFASIAMALWIAMLTGRIPPAGPYGAVEWHAHEFLWGYFSAVVAGFLLTAIPNWTGRLPIAGLPLGALWLVWLCGRIAMFLPGHIPPAAAAMVDVSFLVIFAAVAAREIIAGRNWRNLKVLAILALVIAGNVVFHAEAIAGGTPASGVGLRIGLAAAILLIAVVGGRIVPSFTRNWLVRRNPGFLPIPFGRVDVVMIVITAFGLVTWIVAPNSVVYGVMGGAAGLANLARLARWAGWRTLAEPLVAILHVGFMFLPLGFLMTAAAAIWPDAIDAATARHAWMAGAIVVMSLAVMTRASLGHTGQPLTAGPAVTAIYGLALTAVIARLAYGWLPGGMWLLHLAALAWIAAFLGFAAVYGPILLRKRA